MKTPYTYNKPSLDFWTLGINAALLYATVLAVAALAGVAFNVFLICAGF